MEEKPKGAIVAIGGGQIFTPCKELETTNIDAVSISLARLIQVRYEVNVLFVPTASKDDILYCNTVYNHFHVRFGCNYDHLRILEEDLSDADIRRKIEWADVIYVGGGNTRLMMSEWKKRGVDKLLVKAYYDGAVMTGLSAGSICWFEHGLSDSEKHDGIEDWKPIWVKGLGLIKMDHSPHFNSESEWRFPQVEKRVVKNGRRVLALDDNTALVVMGGKWRIVKCRKDALAFKVYCHDGKVIGDDLYFSKDWQDLSLLTD